MSHPDSQSLGDSSYPRCIESLRKMHKEARTVLDHQIRIIDDIDDKATRTVRITALLLGVVASLSSLVAESSIYVNQATKWGTVSLVLAVILGTFTYSVSSPALGPGPRDIERVRENEFREDEWLVVTLASYEDWIDRTDRISRFNGVFLGLTQMSLGVGLLLLVLGILDSLGANISFVSLSPYAVPVQFLAALGFVGFLASLIQRVVDVAQ